MKYGPDNKRHKPEISNKKAEYDNSRIKPEYCYICPECHNYLIEMKSIFGYKFIWCFKCDFTRILDVKKI